MTAEIGIINQRGLALAADSALTISSNQSVNTKNNATKLFTLGRNHDVAIMIYNNDSFMGLPWETIIDSFKEKIIYQPALATLDDYKNKFYNYVHDLDLFNDKEKADYVVNSYCNQLISNYLKTKTESDFADLLWQYKDVFVKQRHKVLDLDFNDFVKNYGQEVLNYLHQNFIQSNQEDKIFLQVLYEYIISDELLQDEYTGIVFAGYGAKEIFPSIISTEIDCFFANSLKEIDISENSTDPRKKEIISAIVPFAQHKMVDTIINGIDPALYNWRHEELVDLDQKLVNHFGSDQADFINDLMSRKDQEFDRLMGEHYREPVLNMLETLSLGEMATMAETMVSLTAFKQKFIGDLRTVGGPVDVLVISKSNGATWVKHQVLKDG